MKIAVTGGAGFIGSHIVDIYLKNGHEVIIIDNLSTGTTDNLNPDAKLYVEDINSKKVYDIFKREKFDIVNHHAAQIDVRTSVKDPSFDASVNILGSLNIYEAAKETGVKKIIFASSGGAIYGEQSTFPVSEDHPTNPISPYGIAKLINEKYLFYYKTVYGIDYVCLRYANVYGPRQNYHGEAGVVAIFINNMLSNRQPVINGDGKNSRDYIYVSDVAMANLLALNPELSGEFNIGTSIERDVNYIFTKLKVLAKSDCKEIHGESKAGEQRRSVISYNKIFGKCGWSPTVKIDEGLMLTTDYFMEQSKK